MVPVLIGLAVAACGADVTAYRSATYAPRDLTLSVLGVFRNGRMDSGAWNEWSQTIAAATGDASCSAAFDDRMEKAAPALFSELDESTRQDGITDEILDRMAPSARGGAILVIEAFGRGPPKKAGTEEAQPQQAPASSPAPMGRRGGRGGRRGATPTSAPRESPREELEISIGVYSVHDHQVTASVQMHADAGSSTDALHELSAKLGETLHGARCAGWTWQDAAVAK
jgi:hypothetical protein